MVNESPTGSIQAETEWSSQQIPNITKKKFKKKESVGEFEGGCVLSAPLQRVFQLHLPLGNSFVFPLTLCMKVFFWSV